MKKKIIIASIVISSILLSAEGETTTSPNGELDWVDVQIEAIKPPRKGMSSIELVNAKSPFIYLKKNRPAVAKKASNGNSTKPNATTTSSTNSGTAIGKQPLGRLALGAVINNSALINGKWYKLKDNVYGYRLSSIKRTTVVLTKGGKKVILTTTDTNQNLKFK